jgi:hypothetical protein
VKKEFHGRLVSQQYIQQMRYRAAGLCIICLSPQSGSSINYCLRHLIAARERSRRKTKALRRNQNSPSYQEERQTNEVLLAPIIGVM